MPRLFGEKLRYLRRRRGLIQVDLASQLGLAGQSYLTNIETGKDVASLATILRVANFFSISADALLRDSVPLDSLEEPVRHYTHEPQLSPEHFGGRLRELRLEHGITQAALARQLGLTQQSAVSNLESSRKWPSPELVVRAADYFGLRTDDLLTPARSSLANSPASDS
jgi:transcriptional regulator with XRE-family HTH domain